MTKPTRLAAALLAALTLSADPWDGKTPRQNGGDIAISCGSVGDDNHAIFGGTTTRDDARWIARYCDFMEAVANQGLAKMSSLEAGYNGPYGACTLPGGGGLACGNPNQHNHSEPSQMGGVPISFQFNASGICSNNAAQGCISDNLSAGSYAFDWNTDGDICRNWCATGGGGGSHSNCFPGVTTCPVGETCVPSRARCWNNFRYMLLQVDRDSFLRTKNDHRIANYNSAGHGSAGEVGGDCNPEAGSGICEPASAAFGGQGCTGDMDCGWKPTGLCAGWCQQGVCANATNNGAVCDEETDCIGAASFCNGLGWVCNSNTYCTTGSCAGAADVNQTCTCDMDGQPTGANSCFGDSECDTGICLPKPYECEPAAFTDDSGISKSGQGDDPALSKWTTGDCLEDLYRTCSDGICVGGADAGTSCDENSDCASNSCGGGTKCATACLKSVSHCSWMADYDGRAGDGDGDGPADGLTANVNAQFQADQLALGGLAGINDTLDSVFTDNTGLTFESDGGDWQSLQQCYQTVTACTNNASCPSGDCRQNSNDQSAESYTIDTIDPDPTGGCRAGFTSLAGKCRVLTKRGWLVDNFMRWYDTVVPLAHGGYSTWYDNPAAANPSPYFGSMTDHELISRSNAILADGRRADTYWEETLTAVGKWAGICRPTDGDPLYPDWGRGCGANRLENPAVPTDDSYACAAGGTCYTHQTGDGSASEPLGLSSGKSCYDKTDDTWSQCTCPTNATVCTSNASCGSGYCAPNGRCCVTSPYYFWMDWSPHSVTGACITGPTIGAFCTSHGACGAGGTCSSTLEIDKTLSYWWDMASLPGEMHLKPWDGSYSGHGLPSARSRHFTLAGQYLYWLPKNVTYYDPIHMGIGDAALCRSCGQANLQGNKDIAANPKRGTPDGGDAAEVLDACTGYHVGDRRYCFAEVYPEAILRIGCPLNWDTGLTTGDTKWRSIQSGVFERKFQYGHVILNANYESKSVTLPAALGCASAPNCRNLTDFWCATGGGAGGHAACTPGVTACPGGETCQSVPYTTSITVGAHTGTIVLKPSYKACAVDQDCNLGDRCTRASNTQCNLTQTSDRSCAVAGSGFCGDGSVGGVEQCDDGNAVNTDACKNDCTNAMCGDGVVRTTAPTEACDDGNVLSGDCCSSSCTLEANGAACDDGLFCSVSDTCNGAGACSGQARNCADADICTDDSCNEGTNQCDHVFDESNDPSCSTATCGNGSVEGSEQCDDGNLLAGDCCTASCTRETAGVEAANLIANPTFATNDLTSWTFFGGGTATASAATGRAVVTLSTQGPNVQLYQFDRALTGGARYRMMFNAKIVPSGVPQAEDLAVKLFKNLTPFTSYVNGPFPVYDLTSSLKTYCHTFPITPGDKTDARFMVWMADDGAIRDEIDDGQDVYTLDDFYVQKLLCGNGTVDAGEGCDDGNYQSGDGCSDQCVSEIGKPTLKGGKAEGATLR